VLDMTDLLTESDITPAPALAPTVTTARTVGPVAPPATRGVPDADRGILRFASFNMHRGVDVHNNPYDEIAACAGLRADVLALQEAPNAQRIGDALGYHVAHAASGETDVALLSREPMERLEDLALPSGCCGTRLVVRAYVRHGDRTVRAACTHLCHLPHGSTRQLLALRRWLDDPVPVDVLAGDLNMWRAVVTRMLPTLRPVVEQATWPAHRPHSQIDHVLLGHAFAGGSGTAVTAGASDHLALRTELRLV
jgi:endonuclease/exonuclease/phosphatase family metal-dependent hydrolase